MFRLTVRDALLYIASAADSLNQILIVRSFQIGPPIKAAILSLARVLIMMALGVIVCSEQILLFHAFGAVLLLSSISLVILRKKQEPKSGSVMTDCDSCLEM